MSARATAALAFAETLCLARCSRARFEAWQARRLDLWLRHDLPRAPFYAEAEPRLEALSVTDKALVMSRFEDFNRGGITASDGWAALATGRIGGAFIGASTGTSGNRSLYVITEAERFRWLGTILAKTIPAFLFHPERVAIILPQSSALYDGANRLPGLALRFYDLREGPEVWLPALEAFAPTTIVAPPRVLRHLAEHAGSLAPRRLFSGAETLDPVDRQAIEARFGLTLGQIYMASEGLFGVTCGHGRLHLAEDANHFEFEPVGDLVSPLVTSFRRSFQIMARYRMNDLLRLSPAPCPCGSPLRVVEEVAGRMDDVFTFGPVLITPDILRNAVLDASREITDFRLVRETDGSLCLTLPPEISEGAAEAARRAVQECLARRGIEAEPRLARAPLGFAPGAKLRRVENRLRGAA